jgi:transposase-like protein
MNIIQIYKQFPTEQHCIAHLENARWKGEPTCPYCKSKQVSSVEKENRYHCNTCNTSFSVTVGTIFHNTKLDLQKWFLAITLVLNAKKGISSRQLSRDIEVNKDTAWRMLMQIRKSMVHDGEMLQGIVEADETYIGGKNKNRHNDKKTKGGQGRGGDDKTPVFGVLERGGKVKAGKVKDVTAKTLKGMIKQFVAIGTSLMTDEWRAYNGLSNAYNHSVVSHGSGQYVNGIAHTNTLEGFWSLLKRGIIGQYHYVTPKYLNRYIDEFCYRYNNRLTVNLFEQTILKSVNA